MYLLIGQNINHYTITEKIGAGSYSTVYKATHPNFEYPVVIKALHLHHLKNQHMLKRFQLEAQALARLQHANIVPIYDYFQDDDGAYLVLKWMDGGTLRDKMNYGLSFSLEQIAYLLDEIAGALAAAHTIGIVHRDVKPDNVLFDRRGSIYLTDFGIAKQIDKDITIARTVLGTPAYLAPEQIVSKFTTPQSDIYSLGIMLYEIIVGVRPFTHENAAQVMLKHINERVPMITHEDFAAQKHINMVIQRATAKSPHERYTDVRDMAADFRSMLMEARYAANS